MTAPPISPLLARLRAPGPKRILACEGGGVRGLIALGFLAEVERMLRQRYGNPDLVLADYFDLIGGTSTGSVIAASLALGMKVEDIRRRYLALSAKVFGKKNLIPLWSPEYDSRPLEDELRNLLGEHTTLGDPRLRTGLCVVAKRADTWSTWPLLNHPEGKYYGHNKDIPLWEAVRASAAAPGYFDPQRVHVGAGEDGLFLDGAVTMANNPALLLFLVATLQGFPFHWPTGEHRLLLLSVGTGGWRRRDDPELQAGYKLWNWAAEIPMMLIADASQLGQIVLQGMSRSRTARVIDSEIGDMAGDLWTGEPALTYTRYDVRLELDELKALGWTPTEEMPLERLRRLDPADAASAAAAIGRRAARRDVHPDDFPAAFDPPAARPAPPAAQGAATARA